MAEPQQQWTPLALVRVSAEFLAERGIESARLDAELLLAHVLGVNRMTLYVDHARPVIARELDEYRELIRERGRRVPLQLLVGSVHMLDLRFEVRAGVFIPRPETEVLIRKCLELLPDGARFAAEVGVGSGCIAVSLLHAWPDARMIGWDLSEAALELSLANAQQHGVADRLELIHGDGCAALGERASQFDLVVSNPPYVGLEERELLAPEVRDHDPADALFAGADGMDCIERLVPAAAGALKPEGWLVMEHGSAQGQRTTRLLRGSSFESVSVSRDLSGLDRVSVGRSPA